jgi:hypothetical protein
MIKISAIPVLTRIISKLDLKPVMEKLKEIEIFSESQAGVTKEQAGILAFELIAAVSPQLGTIGEDIPEFVALYKGCSVAEANELDFAAVIGELVADEGIRNFFSIALRQKAGQK